jgi:uncharacterized protein
VRAAALLHDVEGTAPGEAARANHHHASADFAAAVLADEGWPVKTHRRCAALHSGPPLSRQSRTTSTIEAKVLFDADKLDVLGAIGAARVVIYAAIAGQPLYVEPSERFCTAEIKNLGNRTAHIMNFFLSCPR